MLLITYTHIYIEAGVYSILFKAQYGIIFSEHFSLVVWFETIPPHHTPPQNKQTKPKQKQQQNKQKPK